MTSLDATPKASIRAALFRAGKGVGVIVLAALAVGLAYNRISPLGIRGMRTPDAVAIVEPAAPEITRVAGSPYGNQTLAIAWIESKGAASPASGPLIVSNAPLRHVTWKELKPEVERGMVTLVDARMPFQFQAGHIPNAVSLPAMATDAELGRFAASVSRLRPLVVYCSNEDCPMADRLGQKLTGRYAFRNVRVLQGGYVAYRQAEARPTAASANAGGAEEEDL